MFSSMLADTSNTIEQVAVTSQLLTAGLDVVWIGGMREAQEPYIWRESKGELGHFDYIATKSFSLPKSAFRPLLPDY